MTLSASIQTQKELELLGQPLISAGELDVQANGASIKPLEDIQDGKIGKQAGLELQ